MGSIARPSDTTAEAHRLQGEIYRRMTGAERLSIAFELTATVRRLTMAGIRARHPEYGDEDVLIAYARLMLGDDVVRQVWPHWALVVP